MPAECAAGTKFGDHAENMAAATRQRKGGPGALSSDTTRLPGAVGLVRALMSKIRLLPPNWPHGAFWVAASADRSTPQRRSRSFYGIFTYIITNTSIASSLDIVL